MQKRNFTQIEASPLEVAIKQLEMDLKADMLKACSISETTDVRLIPQDIRNTYILFISDNNISHNGDNSITIRVYYDGNKLTVKDSRINNMLADSLLYSELMGTEAITLDKILTEFASDLTVFRIKLDIPDMTIFLSGYNDYIDDNLQKTRFPMWSEKKFKIFGSLEAVTKLVEVIQTQHPKLKVTWI